MVAARAAEEPPATGSRLAIVATAAADSGLVDLLTAELAKEPGLALVERQAIGNVLDELRVSQVAADADTTLKLGQMLAADALLLVEPEPTAEPPRTRLRIVETKTGIRLGDWPVPAAGLAAGDMADVLGGLRLALAKVGVPPGARQLVGMIGILPEAASGDLAALARSLTVLVEQDLQALPDVVILERQQLRRLTSEHDLTGIERGLKTSTRLVEGGLRREGDRLVLTLQFVPLTGGAGPKATVESTRPIRGDREHAAAFAARVDALIAAKAYAAAVQPAAEFYRQRAALLNAHENRPTRVAPPEGGPLDAYETVPVRTTGVDRDFGILAMIHVDRSAGGDQRRPLVLVCAKHHGFPLTPSPSDPPEFDYLIGRAGADGREMIVAARCRLPLRVILDMATGGGRVFFGSEQHGLAVVSADGTTMITDRDGLPSDHVGPMAWLDDRLYVAVPAGLAAVDPVTKRCLSIASARSLESRNPLDGTANYAITGLVADPPRGRLVVLVQADFNRVGRYAAGDPAASQTPEGLWSFTPADRTWARLEPGGVEQLVNGGDHLLYKRGDVLHRLDLASSAITPLAGHSRGGLAYASQRDAEHAFCDGLLFNARSGRARDATGTEHAWRPGTGCQGSGIWRVGGELLVFDEFGNRLFLIRKRTRAATDAPSP